VITEKQKEKEIERERPEERGRERRRQEDRGRKKERETGRGIKGEKIKGVKEKKRGFFIIIFSRKFLNTIFDR